MFLNQTVINQTFPCDLDTLASIKDEKSKNSKLTRELYNKFLNIYTTVPFTENETKIYGDIRYQLEKVGKLIGANVMLIATTVMSHNGILVTHNINEFSRIKGLQIEDWTEN